eukprot:CAMPEP_0206134208 /NCGR_PEP_ID=MMETSP1472-20131121/54766_1 /ASSEMBLY_ACC=CAM_ASM_001108 /TAXON_ID=41880 /ORGANISM="Pycnococcus provasolii, Strain RCC251" /LENGTH=57 /DNA_ID=CAMNT_0053525811 /DNA_START=76 /DNA_END=249 /DNA_ORIENTATION=+
MTAGSTPINPPAAVVFGLDGGRSTEPSPVDISPCPTTSSVPAFKLYDGMWTAFAGPR